MSADTPAANGFEGDAALPLPGQMRDTRTSSEAETVGRIRRALVVVGVSLCTFGLAASTTEILGCISLPVNAILFHFGTSTHEEPFKYLPDFSKYIIMVGVFSLLIAWIAFTKPGAVSRVAYRARPPKQWQAIRRRTHVIVLLLIFGHIAITKSGLAKIPAVCPSSGAMLAITGVFGIAAIFWLCLFVLTIFFGRFVCSWLCVYAPVQEQAANLLIGIGSNPNRKYLEARDKKTFWQKMTLYSLTASFWLALSLAVIENRGHLVLDYRLGSFEACDNWLFVGGLLTMFPMTVLLVHYFGTRYFCRHLCPVGGLLSLLGKASFLRIGIDGKACNECAACEKNCQMGVDIKKYRNGGKSAISAADCIICGDCIDACAQGCMSYELALGRPKRTTST